MNSRGYTLKTHDEKVKLNGLNLLTQLPGAGSAALSVVVIFQQLDLDFDRPLRGLFPPAAKTR
jgi:hypothetical protein